MKRLCSLVLLSSVACSVAVEAPPIDDKDLDTIVDQLDNCPEVANTAQTDEDGDGIGNTCDNCMSDYNPSQVDSDSDGMGDVCDACPRAFGRPGVSFIYIDLLSPSSFFFLIISLLISNKRTRVSTPTVMAFPTPVTTA